MLQEEKESENEEDGEQPKSPDPSASARAGLTLANSKAAPAANRPAAGTPRLAPICTLFEQRVLCFIVLTVFTSDFFSLSAQSKKQSERSLNSGPILTSLTLKGETLFEELLTCSSWLSSCLTLPAVLI